MPVVSMSKREFTRLEVLLQVQSGRLRVADACELIGLRRRQIFRLLVGLKQAGAASLVSKHRGRPSNNRLPAEFRDLAMSLVRERYADFGPTLAAEKLAELHGCAVSRETLRGWMIAEGHVDHHSCRSGVEGRNDEPSQGRKPLYGEDVYHPGA